MLDTALAYQAKQYLLDRVLLSAARLAPVAWLILTLHNILAVVRPFQLGIFGYWFPVLQGFGLDTILPYGFSGFIVTMILWGLAETFLDKERSRDHKAFEKQLPAAQAKIERLETQLKTERAEHKSTIKKLEEQISTNQTLEAVGKTNAGLVIDRNTEIDTLKKSLKQITTERDVAIVESVDAEYAQEVAEDKADHARYLADQETIKELGPQLTGMIDFYNRLMARCKETENINAKAANAENGNGNGQSVPPATATPPAHVAASAPKVNYLK